MNDCEDMTDVKCIKVNLQSDEREALGPIIVDLLDSYARDLFGGLEPLPDYTKENLIDKLAALSIAHVFLARVGSEYCGLTICFDGFSTFACKPLINIHDMYVKPSYRGKGVASSLLLSVGEFLVCKNLRTFYKQELHLASTFSMHHHTLDCLTLLYQTQRTTREAKAAASSP
jgi:GNAT superfamily N-acetyltransferase